MCMCVFIWLQDFDNALKLAAGPVQRDVVYQAMGADAAAAGDWKAAGERAMRVRAAVSRAIVRACATTPSV